MAGADRRLGAPDQGGDGFGIIGDPLMHAFHIRRQPAIVGHPGHEGIQYQTQPPPPRMRMQFGQRLDLDHPAQRQQIAGIADQIARLIVQPRPHMGRLGQTPDHLLGNVVIDAEIVQVAVGDRPFPHRPGDHFGLGGQARQFGADQAGFIAIQIQQPDHQDHRGQQIDRQNAPGKGRTEGTPAAPQGQITAHLRDNDSRRRTGFRYVRTLRRSRGIFCAGA